MTEGNEKQLETLQRTQELKGAESATDELDSNLVSKISKDSKDEESEGDNLENSETEDPGEENMGMAELLAQSDAQQKKIRRGKLCEGTVESIKEGEIHISFTAVKYNGIISGEEVLALKEIYKVGDPIKGIVISVDERANEIRLSVEKAKQHFSWNEIQNHKKNETTVPGTVKAVAKKGGFEVDILGLRAFLPLSQAGNLARESENLVGRNLDFRILEFDRKSRNIVVSHKILVQEKAEERFNEIKQSVKTGDKISGKVTRIMNYGAFVDLGGFEGLVHRKDLSWSAVHNPENHVKEGETHEFMVLSISEDSQRIGLGLKQLKEDPWAKIQATYSIGQTVDGSVRNLTEFGAFIELEEGIEGLVHVSDISWEDFVKNPADVLKIGEKVQVKIMSLEPENHKLSLSIKHTQKEPWDRAVEELKEGSDVRGIVKNTTHFGAFVEILPGVEGLLHVSDLSWDQKIAKPEDFFTKGQNIEVKILSVDKKTRRVSLGYKQLQPDPWTALENKYGKNTVISGKVCRIVNFGAFVELEPGVEGLVHISELSWNQEPPNPEDFFIVGEQRDFKILGVDARSKKISLGIKQLSQDPWENYAQKYSRFHDFEGVISRVEKHGVYVRLEEGLEGLVPKAHLAEEPMYDATQNLVINTKVKVRILEVNRKERKVKLSIKEAGKATPQEIEEAGKTMSSVENKETIGDMISGAELRKLRALLEIGS